MSAGASPEVESRAIAYVHTRAARLLGVAARGTAALTVGGYLVGSRLGLESAGVDSGFLGYGLAGAIWMGCLAVLVEASHTASPGTVSRDGDALVLHRRGRGKLRVRGVRGGHLLAVGARTRAELHLDNGDRVIADTDDPATAVDILRVAGVDAAHRHARIRPTDPLSWVMGFGLVAFLLGLATWSVGLPLATEQGLPGLVAWLAGILGTALVAMGFVALPEMTVGTDGVWYRRGLFRTFIPLADIDEVRASSGVTLTFLLRGGKEKRLRSLCGADGARVHSLDLRIREARAAHGAEHQPEQLELLDRKGRSVAEWSKSLESLARAGSSYRAVGLSADDLEIIVTSPEVSPERRLGAALALRASGYAAAPERIRIAAAQCASSRLRIALERVGEGAVDLEAISDALAETEAPEEPQKVSRAR